MKRDEAVLKLRGARRDLLAFLTDMSEEDLTRAKAVGDWSVKDLLAHIASWDEEYVRIIQAFAMQSEPVFGYKISDRNDFASWNSEQIRQREDLTLEQVRREFDVARRDLIQVIEGLTDPVLSRVRMTPWGKEKSAFDLVSEAIEHDLDHSRNLESYRKKRERWSRARQRYVARRREGKK